MPQIISFSGNLGSGKDTVGDNAIEYLIAKGKTAKKFFFSEKLKQFAVEVLGLNPEHVYGTQEDKNKVTHLKWEDMPGVVIVEDNSYYKDFSEIRFALGSTPAKFIAHRGGYMSVREFLQFFGTEIGRKIYNNIWIDATFREIQKSDCDFAIVTDARFHNELNYLLNYGTILVKLTRKPINIGLSHSSETELDSYTRYTEVLDNRNMSLEEQKTHVIQLIEKYFHV